MIYKEIIESKTSQKIPVFNSGKAAHSKYDPEREAQNFGTETNGATFAIILGVAGGYHIKAFVSKNPNCKILAVEKSRADYVFLLNNIPCITELASNKNFRAVFPENLQEEIFNNYFPALYGDISILTLRAWADEDKAFYDDVVQTIQGALKQIGADFSVQSHFGALWLKNIFCNLKTLHKMQNDSSYAPPPMCIDTKKTAAIIAAGPSLDKTADFINAARQNYFVIATDTSFKALMRRGITTDAAVSIDAQILSANHFIGKKSRDTIFVFSLDADSSTAAALYKNNCRIIFTSSGHPLIEYASQFCEKPFPRLQSGSGTVTIAAADFAKKCGFSRLQFFGADFAYSCGKPYTKGSYLDDLYRQNESRLKNAESRFAALMFRTSLEKFFTDKIAMSKTEVLDSYKKTFVEWLEQNAESFEYENFIWNAKTAKNSNFDFDIEARKFSMTDFKNSIQNEKKENLLKPALPYMAFLHKKKLKTFCTTDNFSLALNKILWYNMNL